MASGGFSIEGDFPAGCPRLACAFPVHRLFVRLARLRNRCASTAEVSGPLYLFEDPPDEEEECCSAEDHRTHLHELTPFKREFHRFTKMHLRCHPPQRCQTNEEKDRGNTQPQTAALPCRSGAAETLSQRLSCSTCNPPKQAIELQTG